MEHFRQPILIEAQESGIGWQKKMLAQGRWHFSKLLGQ
jgi:hypothetical protein